VGQLLDDLSGMAIAGGRKDALDVDPGGVAFEIAIGNEQQAVAGLKLQPLGPVGVDLDTERGPVLSSSATGRAARRR
jgi:hypothetical protein